MSKEHEKLSKTIGDKFNKLPQEERRKIILYTTNQQMLTLIHIKNIFRDYLPPIAKRKITEFENNVYKTLQEKYKELENE